MKRRTFIRAAGLTAVSISSDAFPRIDYPSPAITTIIRGGRCYLESGLQPADVAIDDAGKLKIGPPNSIEGGEVIRAEGKVVAPGFIDILADNAASPEKTYPIFEKYKVSDGVTTALQMHGGSGDCSAYYNSFTAKPHHVNFGVSTAVMRVRYATTNLAERKRRVEKCLNDGALGVSHSIEYQPTPYAETLEYAKLAAKYNRPFFLHLRYSSAEKELEGVDEAIRWATDSGARVHIDHLHSTGGTFHMQEALGKIRTANSRGLKITCCVYPYSYWATYLHSKRFDEGWQKRYGLTYNDLRLVGTGERLTEQSFAKYRELKKLVAVPEGTMPLGSTVDLALKEDFCMIGSDGGIEYEPNANSHPRGAGCFATSIRHGLDIGLPLDKILEKIITLPRNLIGAPMKDRGVLADGAWADITIFDPATTKARATVANPNQFSMGVDRVFVNGTLAYQNGKLGRTAGKPIRY